MRAELWEEDKLWASEELLDRYLQGDSQACEDY